MLMLTRTRSRPLAPLAAIALAACGGADESSPPEEDPGNADLLIESVMPESGALVARNQKVTIVFRNTVVADSLAVEIGGELVPLVTLDDREFRFVPFPLHEADTQYEVAIQAGAEDVEGQVLDRDFSWSFTTDAVAVEELPAPPLSAEEIALIDTGDGAAPMDLVVDYENPDSGLYQISQPIDPSSPHLALFVERMFTSVVHHGGVGLAAPQVGINRRLFVAQVDGGFRAFVNPTAHSWSDAWDSMAEGCLSVPEREVPVWRPSFVEYSYHTPDGTLVDSERLENSGQFPFPARIWLHEFDHLNGILLLDRASSPPAL